MPSLDGLYQPHRHTAGRAALGCTLILSAACAGAPGGEQAATPVTPPNEDSAPWTVDSAAPDTSDGIRVLVLHDMEGLAGQDDWHSFDFGDPQYPHGQEMLAADINAVIDGLFAGGATEVHVVDGHGSGNPDPDVRADLLDPRASQVLRDAPFDTYFDVPETSSYDAVAVVGMHAKTGSKGFASHTFTLGMDLILNGASITETELVALSWGRFGVPIIFGSGDNRLAEDLRTMPWIEFVTVKTATSASSVELRPVDEAHADMRAAAQRAVENLADAGVMRVREPIRAVLRAVPPASLEILEGVPGIDYVDNTVGFDASDLRTAYDGLEALITVARNTYVRVLIEQLRERNLMDEFGPAYGEALSMRWLDFESERWSPPAPDGAPERRQYHGYS
ncbi:MAG TPA: M55 family metallopeptidase [Acidobacteriota bacterium]|nr:M55 family metallopeptidase [Acidobacteriota bacterium]